MADAFHAQVGNYTVVARLVYRFWRTATRVQKNTIISVHSSSIKKFSSLETLSSSIAFQQYTVQFRRGLVCWEKPWKPRINLQPCFVWRLTENRIKLVHGFSRQPESFMSENCFCEFYLPIVNVSSEENFGSHPDINFDVIYLRNYQLCKSGIAPLWVNCIANGKCVFYPIIRLQNGYFGWSNQ